MSPAKREAFLRSQRRCLGCAEKLGFKEANSGITRCPACIADDAARRAVRDARVRAMREDGASPNTIAREMGISQSTVCYILNGDKRPTKKPRGESHANLPRCRCGLLLPCNGCVGSIYTFASQRREWP